MKFKVGDRVKCLNSKGLKFGVITASQESGVTGRTWYIVQPASNSEWCNESELELIQEWVDEVTLPAVKIKQWAVVYSKFVPDIVSRNRGEIFTIFTSPEGHKAAADILLQYPNIPLEIVELTGTLPERKQ